MMSYDSVFFCLKGQGRGDAVPVPSEPVGARAACRGILAAGGARHQRGRRRKDGPSKSCHRGLQHRPHLEAETEAKMKRFRVCCV